MTQSADPTITLVQTLIAEAKRLGLVWTLRPATVVSGDGSALVVQMDGDDSDTNITAVNMLGQGVTTGTRVMTITVPPGGLFVVGLTAQSPGYRLLQRVKFTTTDTFFKADYPGIRAVQVRVIGGGGGGGGAQATGATSSAIGAGGGGGGYSEEFLLESVLAIAGEAVTVGTGGAGGVAGLNNGTTGVASSFGTTPFLTANPGTGGEGGPVGASNNFITAGGSGGTGSGGFLNVAGSDGSNGIRVQGFVGGVQAGTVAQQGAGGASGLGYGGSTRGNATDASGAGANGSLYGGGGAGGHNEASGPAVAGGDGAAGLVLIDVFV